MTDKNISVVVPTFNRAHLIAKTLPSYLKNNRVAELIVVNDCSTDNTGAVVSQLQEQYPQIKLINLVQNSRQPAAKNVGMRHASCEYIFFGDDDSFVLPHAIDELYQSLVDEHADMAGTRALYLKTSYDIDHLPEFLVQADAVKDKLLNFAHMQLNFHVNTGNIVEVPLCHAYFLIKKEQALQIKFDENFIGNCFREETDFSLRAFASGLKIIFNPHVPQFNYPRHLATGGASGIPKVKYVAYALINNWYFLNKNQQLIRQHLKVSTPLWLLQYRVFWQLFKQSIRVSVRNWFRDE